MKAEGETRITRYLYRLADTLPAEERERLRAALGRFDHLETGEITVEDVTLINDYLGRNGAWKTSLPTKTGL